MARDLSSLTTKEFKLVIQRLQSAGITPDQAVIDEMHRRFFDQAVIDAIVYGTSFSVHGTTQQAEPSFNPEPKKAPPVSNEQLPKQELLLKLLKMTTSSNDAEALVAIRKVNRMLTDNGWDWDKFVAGKIKIVENPFVGLGTPPRRNGASTPMTQAPPPPPKAPLAGQRVRSLGINRYADFCYCCGIEVVAQAGGFFKREDYNLNAKNANPRSPFSVVCKSCDGKEMIWDQPAPQIRRKGKAAVGDLA